jgi:ketosteroid isomerase-like protein
VWKISSLAVLFNGLDERLLREQGSMDKKSEMMDRAARLQVALKREDDGWKLRAHTGH